VDTHLGQPIWSREQHLLVGAAARPARQAPPGCCHVCTGSAGGPTAGGTANCLQQLLLLFGLDDLLREWNEQEAAERHLAQGMVLVKETLTVEPFVAVLGYTALARLQQARSNTAAALMTLDVLARLAQQRHLTPQVMTQVATRRAQLELT
jgi:hypothetical protein